jgi:hypothetical protein
VDSEDSVRKSGIPGFSLISATIMRFSTQHLVVSLICAMTVSHFCSSANAQQPAGTHIEQTAFNERANANQPSTPVTFGHRTTNVGDQTEQTVNLDVRLMLTMRRANEVLGKHQSTIRTHQRRVLTTTAVDGGVATAVSVTYPEATRQVVGVESAAAAGAPDQPAAASEQTTPQPVQGKTYLCRRDAGPSGKLTVTDESGNTPPADEYEIVAQQMDTVGRPNPLARFLSGKSISVGQKIELPKEVAKQIFNLGDKFGEVTQFTLTLQKVTGDGVTQRAVFLASVDAASSDSSQMRLQVEGPLVVEVETCRAAGIDLVGPIGMSETRGSFSTSCQVIGTGRLQLHIASNYRESQQ